MSVKKSAKKAPAKKAAPTVRGSFLPDGYELPKPQSQFVALEEGDNRLRILSRAVVGWEAWMDGEAVRIEGEENTFDVDNVDTGDYGKKLYHFWAFIVWNADLKKIQIWQVSQRSILSGLWNLLQQEEWGDPRNYGIIVTKTVTKKKTEYKVVGVPPKPLTEEVKKALADTNLTLEKVFAEEPVEVEPEVQIAKGDDF